MSTDLDDFSRAQLAVLGREWLLHGHLQDRVGMPLVHTGRSREEMEAIAIEEWMAASPVYSLRTQRALKFGNGDVPTILKNIQLDIGAPPHFMDFRCRVDDANHGEFQLAHCGALLDVEPMGEDYVHGMCHAIEDPTFDATAGATNPRAQVRPVHRPPRVPTDRHPHCHWTITIDPEFPPVDAHPYRAIVEQSKLAGIETEEPSATGSDAEPGGWDDYAGDFDPDFELEDLSHRALVIVLQEVAVQSHLLLRGFAIAVAERYGEETALALIPQIFTGLAGITAQRLVPVLDIETERARGTYADAEGIARLLRFHPVFWPRTYVDLRVEVLDDRRVRFALGPSPVLEEADGFTWFSQLGGAGDRALDAIVQAVDPRAACHAVATAGDERFAYEAVIDPDAAPAKEAPEIALAKISGGAAFVFTPRRPVRV
jgi:hypothetical protein